MSKKGIPWDAADEATLRRLFEQGLSDAEIAAEIPRAAGIAGRIKDKRKLLGLLRRPANRPPSKRWVPARHDSILAVHLRTGLTDAQAGEEMGMSRDQVQRARKRLDLPRDQHWTPEQDAQLSKGARRGLTNAEIGALVGKSAKAVDHRKRRLARSS